MSSRDLWTSRLGFILASAGAAVGLGAIWKFPYMAGTNGGAAFIIPYILFSFTLGMFLLLAELAVGRAGRAASINSMIKVGRSKFWGIFGTIGVATGFLILTFYSTVGGWCVAYAVDAILGRGLITDLSQLGAHFGAFAGDATLGIFYQLVFMAMTAGVVIFGVQRGIERLSKYLMPTLFILMIALIIRGLTLPGAWAGVEFMFNFKWEDFTADSLFNAMGFCFFSLSVGAGTLIVYASYLSEDANLPRSTAWVAFLGIMAALLGGLMVMPAVFAFGLEPTAGPGLTFVTMPAVFAHMPFGQFFAVLFYVCLIVAALTSSVSIFEAVTAAMGDLKISRRTAVPIAFISMMAIGIFCTMSFGVLAEIKFFGKTIFDLLDYLTSNVGMPVTALGLSIVAAWVNWPETRHQMTTAEALSPILLTLIRLGIGIISPLVIITVVARSI
ncbi:MAG: sodium-dependent transporter [Candidatus Aphodousia sp.]|nr:sodium-dependent transporter [Sutterella sp.]MDY2900158.1 sodium-dependent transporter [Candidatus Aphodousia sp.]